MSERERGERRSEDEAPHEDEAPPDAARPDAQAPDAAVDRQPAARPKGACALSTAGIFGALFVLNLGYGLLKATLTSSFMGLLFAPLLGTLLGASLLQSYRCARAGKALWSALIVLAVAGALAYLATGSFARGMIFPGCPDALPAPGAPLGRGRVVGYTSDDGVDLKGYLVRGDGLAPHPAVVYFHGNAESAAGNVAWADQIAREGFDVFVAEFRGYGGCAGSPSEDGLVRDGRAALAAFSAEVGASPKDMLLFGRSLGTGVASRLAGEGRGRAVLLLSPYSSLRSMACRLVPAPLAALALRDPFDSQAALLESRQPVTILHGDRDRVVPYAEGQALAEALGDRARFVTLEGCGHNDVIGVASDVILRELKRLEARPG